MVLPSPYIQATAPPAPVYNYMCRFCMKQFKSRLAWKRHEADSHGPRMACGTCKFTCPEGRPGEMRKHLQMKHGVETGSPIRKRRRQSASADSLTVISLSSTHSTTGYSVSVAPPTQRIPAETLAIESYTLSSDQSDFFSSLGSVDLGPDPDVSIGEPVCHIPTYGPPAISESSATLSNYMYMPAPSDVPIFSSSSVAVHQPVSRLSTPPLTLCDASSLSGRSSPVLSVPSPVLSAPQSVSVSAPSTPLASPLAVPHHENCSDEAALSTSLPVTSSESLPEDVHDLSPEASLPLESIQTSAVSSIPSISVHSTLLSAEGTSSTCPLSSSLLDCPSSVALPTSGTSSSSRPVLSSPARAEPCSQRSQNTMSDVTSVTYSDLSGRPSTSVHSPLALPNRLSLPASISLLQTQNTPSALPAGLVDIVTHRYRMVRPPGIDMGTQTEGVAMEDKATEMKWVLQ